MNEPYCSPASERNKHPIFERLRDYLEPGYEVLEIGSGLAQHANYFVSELSGLKWQTSERPEAIGVLQSCLQSSPVAGVISPVTLDVSGTPWPDHIYDVVYSANTAHIMSWKDVQAMFRGVGAVLKSKGAFFLYGPFNVGGEFTAPSNQAFDQNLKSRDPKMGIRDIEALESQAASHQMLLEERMEMPANNFLLLFRKTG